MKDEEEEDDEMYGGGAYNSNDTFEELMNQQSSPLRQTKRYMHIPAYGIGTSEGVDIAREFQQMDSLGCGSVGGGYSSERVVFN